MNINSNNIHSIIEEAWKDAGVDDTSNIPGLRMKYFLEISNDNNKTGVPETIANWIIVFDECGAWFANLASLLMFSLQIDHINDIRTRRVLTCVMGNITAQIIAIRSLVVSGLDVQAKQLLRVLVENLDVALLISKDGIALNDFEKTLDGVSSNKFWHKHISKGKMRPKVFSTLKRIFELNRLFGDNAYQELMDYLKQEEEILGMTIHPSLGASQMACLPSLFDEHKNRKFTLGFVGDVSILSERTLSYAVFYMIFYIIEGYLPKIKNDNDDPDVNKFIEELQSSVSLGRKALIRILAYVVNNSRGAEFSTKVLDDKVPMAGTD